MFWNFQSWGIFFTSTLSLLHIFLLNVFVVFGNFNSYFVSSNYVCNHTCDWQIGFPLRGRQILLITRMITDFEITGGPCYLICSNWCDLFTNHTIFCLKSHLFPANEEATLKKNFQNSYFPLQKMDERISNQLNTASIKYLNWPNPVFGPFQNGCNKVVIESRVVQFWSEIIFVISNWTRTARWFDFEITCMILAQIALHSVQLPLRIGLHSVLLPLLIS